jgi:hypothetical protein
LLDFPCLPSMVGLEMFFSGFLFGFFSFPLNCAHFFSSSHAE